LPAGQAFDHAERLPFLSQRNQIADSLRLIAGARMRIDASRKTILALPVTGGSGTRGPVRAGRGWFGRASAGSL
jgi:hypothetical protein